MPREPASSPVKITPVPPSSPRRLTLTVACEQVENKPIDLAAIDVDLPGGSGSISWANSGMSDRRRLTSLIFLPISLMPQSPRKSQPPWSKSKLSDRELFKTIKSRIRENLNPLSLGKR